MFKTNSLVSSSVNVNESAGVNKQSNNNNTLSSLVSNLKNIASRRAKWPKNH